MASRAQAPGDLKTVQAFLNTTDLEDGLDELASPSQFAGWLAERGLLESGVEITEPALRAALRVREALRGLALANNGMEADLADLAALDQAAASSRLQVRFQPSGGLRLEPDAVGVEHALGRILAMVVQAIADGTWTRLKVCRQHTCRWAFYDQSRNQSSTWCSMAVCGNRVKAQRFRQRRRLLADDVHDNT